MSIAHLLQTAFGGDINATYLLKTVGCGEHQPQKSPLPMHVAQLEKDLHSCEATPAMMKLAITSVLFMEELFARIFGGWTRSIQFKKREI